MAAPVFYFCLMFSLLFYLSKATPSSVVSAAIFLAFQAVALLGSS